MLSQSILLFLSVLCTIARAAPTPNPIKRSTASRGLLYAPSSGLSAFSGKVDFSLNWATASSAGDIDLGTYVSQYWGTDSNHVKNFIADSGNYEGATLIGYNEADIVTQSWLSPQQAIAGWSVINDYKTSKGAKIGTPAVSNSVLPPQAGTSSSGNYLAANPQGHDWLSAFLDLAKGQYTFDVLNYHWYGGPTNPLKADQDMMQELANNMTTLATAHNITDVWISEMKVTNPATECKFIQWFENTFLPNNPIISGYAYNEQLGSLTNGDGLSTAGQVYLGEGSC